LRARRDGHNAAVATLICRVAATIIEYGVVATPDQSNFEMASETAKLFPLSFLDLFWSALEISDIRILLHRTSLNCPPIENWNYH